MFRMKFQPTADYSSSGDEEDERTVRVDSLVGCSPEPIPKAVLFEGRVGKFGKIQPLPTSDKKPPHFADGLSSLRSMILSPTAQVVPISSPKPELAVVDLVNLEEPAQDSTDSLPREATVVLNAKSLPVNDRTTDKTTVVACLHYQDSAEGQDSKVVLMEAVVEPPCALLEARTDSSRSESSECSTSTCRSEEEDEAMREVIDKLMEERKNILLKSDHKFSKPSEEPLLAAHDQEELELMAKKEARVEAKRLAEEERLERERELREIRALAHCDTVSARPLGRSPIFKKSKLKGILSTTGVTGVYRFLKRPFRIFRSHKKHTEYPNAREAKVIAPKPSLFGGCRTVPSSGTTHAQLAMMRNAPRPGLTRLPHIKFAMVESTQRDVPAWTREEYLRKNGRIPHHSTSKNDDEEFGGIEGNNLMNQYFDDGILTDYDSDSD